MENPQLTHTAKAFTKWRGADGQLVSYDPTGQIATLALWYGLMPDRGYLQLGLSGCTRLELPVKWGGSMFSITRLESAMLFKIEDHTLGILIVCSEIGAIPRKERFWHDLQ